MKTFTAMAAFAVASVLATPTPTEPTIKPRATLEAITKKGNGMPSSDLLRMKSTTNVP